MDAKQKLIDFVKIIDSKLEIYWKEEEKYNFGFNQRQKDLVKKIILHAEEHNLRPAKRLRASFVYYSYLLGNKTPDEKIYKAAMAAELIHTALLMHDDFMDEDEVRRGLPTTHKYFEDGNKHYGESMAVDVGDAVLLMGYELLMESGFESELVNEATKQYLRGVVNTAFGQASDVTIGRDMNWKEDDVLAIHKGKTAIYTYENPLFTGAILGEVSKETYSILHDYSMDGGLAFQIQDDILGVFGDSEKTGKSDDSDLLQGKVTLLVLEVMKSGSEQDKKDLMAIWSKRKAEKNDIEKAKAAIINCGALDHSRKISKEYAAKAVVTAEKLRSLNLNKEAIDYIQGIAEYMVNRDV